MMNAAERATRTAQAKHQHNTAVLKEIEVLMDTAMEQGESTVTYPTAIHPDAVEDLQEAGYSVLIRGYYGTTINW